MFEVNFLKTVKADCTYGHGGTREEKKKKLRNFINIKDAKPFFFSKFVKMLKYIHTCVTDKSTSTKGIRTTDPQFECPSALPTEIKGNSH